MMNAKNILSIIAGALALAACSGPQEENLRMVPLTVPATVPMTSYGPHARVVVAGIDYTEVHDEWMNPDIMKKATPGNTRVVISRGRQRGQLMVGDEVAMDFPVCVGKASHRTPVGHFRITEKAVHHVSNLYDASMPYFMRLTDSGIGMYVGSVVNGPTAAATYYGKVDLGLGQEPTDSNALVLLFTHENGKWKYDQARFFNLTRLPAVKERLKRGDASVLMEQDGFQPLGKIPAVPPVCPPPKYIAKILVDCPGRTVQANVNNISLHEFDNTRLAEVISGGLRDGTNSLTLNFSDSPNGKKGAVLVEVYIMPEIPGHLPARAFSYFVPPQAQPKSGPVLINVTPELLKTMEPKNSSPKAAAGK